jgi:hypothetical protein
MCIPLWNALDTAAARTAWPQSSVWSQHVKRYAAGIRFVCVGHPQPYETVRSEFDLRTAFQTYFDQADVPMISGISLGVDTLASGEGGTAAGL